MNLFKCTFTFDTGVTIKEITKYVFLETSETHINKIRSSIKLALQINLFDSNDCSITNLRITKVTIYDGFVI